MYSEEERNGRGGECKEVQDVCRNMGNAGSPALAAVVIVVA